MQLKRYLPKPEVWAAVADIGAPTRGGTLNTTTLTITADQRAPIHRQAIQRLSGIGDVNLAIERGDYASAERLADEYAEDLALLADLGWAPGDSRDSFELTMRAGELMQTLQRCGAMPKRASASRKPAGRRRRPPRFGPPTSAPPRSARS